MQGCDRDAFTAAHRPSRTAHNRSNEPLHDTSHIREIPYEGKMPACRCRQVSEATNLVTQCSALVVTSFGYRGLAGESKAARLTSFDLFLASDKRWLPGSSGSFGMGKSTQVSNILSKLAGPGDPSRILSS